MKRLFFLFVALSSCSAHADLSGKVLVFPKETNTDHVKLVTSVTHIPAYTTCMRFLTDLPRAYSLLSMASSSGSNTIVFYKFESETIRIHTLEPAADFLSMAFQDNTWHSLCVTWESDNGLSQVWLDGKASVKKFITSGAPINGATNTILGQEQDAYGGGFDAAQSFVGMISDVHMWDHVLTPTEIQRYMKHKYFTAGNVFSWRSLEYEIVGNIFVDDDPEELPWC
ncbi:C-reactive protein-like [Cynoglossus semilaevis]|uniref:Pentraxin family member n=1 Tax=Cynoglossus semilaevis TaxID=244447 RepID=A0A3P8UM87_CYNSE|nr:C-reactive protein-like [Cynoglossus semilaevis]